MEEVQEIHEREEKQLKKIQEKESSNFKKKQELELHAFLNKHKEQADKFESKQSSDWSGLKERHGQETCRLFGGHQRKEEARGSVASLWCTQEKGMREGD